MESQTNQPNRSLRAFHHFNQMLLQILLYPNTCSQPLVCSGNLGEIDE